MRKTSRKASALKVLHMSIGKRIESIRDGLPRKAFAFRIGIVENTLRNYEQELSLPNSDVIARICREFSINTEWLVLGQGPMRKGEVPESDTGIDFEILKEVVASLEHALNAVHREMKPEDKGETVCLLYQYFTMVDDDSEKPAAVLKVLYGERETIK